MNGTLCFTTRSPFAIRHFWSPFFFLFFDLSKLFFNFLNQVFKMLFVSMTKNFIYHIRSLFMGYNSTGKELSSYLLLPVL